MGAMDKQILFSNHAKVKMADRGAFEDEVIKAIKEGSSEPSRPEKVAYCLGRIFRLIVCGGENIIRLNRLPLSLLMKMTEWLLLLCMFIIFREVTQDENQVRC